ncbi:hypothetical protein BDN71DRAFT_1445915 [Pleurotus eryngii]|uniref:Uncharacterized protein n=1 Tax=Pleurotus eryngii TaxID=5323 RepID=A0A9P6DGZ3_PLEER|nr:hypothetical protein BDN71DRAFT_1445915 [Pleurotus eryngii]
MPSVTSNTTSENNKNTSSIQLISGPIKVGPLRIAKCQAMEGAQCMCSHIEAPQLHESISEIWANLCLDDPHPSMWHRKYKLEDLSPPRGRYMITFNSQFPPDRDYGSAIGVSVTQLILGRITIVDPDARPIPASNADTISVVIVWKDQQAKLATIRVRCPHGEISRWYLAYEVCCQVAQYFCCAQFPGQVQLWSFLQSLRLISLVRQGDIYRAHIAAVDLSNM